MFFQSVEDKKQYLGEIDILKELDHPSILRIYEFYEDSNSYYLITEYCEIGNLSDEIKENGNFEEKDAA